MSTALLEIPEFRRRVSPVTVEQYHQFPEFNENRRRIELIRDSKYEVFDFISALASAIVPAIVLVVMLPLKPMSHSIVTIDSMRALTRIARTVCVI